MGIYKELQARGLIVQVTDEEEIRNKPVVLLGGGTGFIGNPSGRTDMRSMVSAETNQHNCDCFLKQIGKFIEFGEDAAIVVNNADWLLGKTKGGRTLNNCFCLSTCPLNGDAMSNIKRLL